MKILVLSWEFPPRIVGGIARHVAELYPELVKLGDEIHLITIEFGDTPHYEVVDGVHLYRVPVESGDNFFHWVANMNESLGALGGKLIKDQPDFDLIHAHDWLVGDAAIALKKLFKIPLVATIHATEYGRHNGIHNAIQRYIYNKENLLVYEAWRVIVCTSYMRQEAERAFAAPWDKIDVIYNGLHLPNKQLPPDFDRLAFRRRFAVDQEKIVYYLGRMSYEKGLAVLIDAFPQVITEMQGKVKLVIVGGGKTDALKQRAWDLGIWHKCYFTGFMPESDLKPFQTIADCAVFPSLYEPFGIVVLESFAAKVPVVVSDTCGLPEVVRHTQTGIVTQTNNPDSLALGILSLLKNPAYTRQLVDNAYQDLLNRFDWVKLAQQTQGVYQRVIEERSQVVW
ncbi:MAG: glycosyltransferase family 4 protein [Kamptonema sp. SIO4C4]|nr:glycosyltransferase family 4 protein [Kamptonema sp. SIO4C4]